MDNRIGAKLYTLRDFCKTLEDFDKSCKKVSEMGYKIVQLSGIGDFTAEEVKKVLDQYGLTCACTHRAPEKYLEQLDEEIAFHKTIGCKVCGLGAMQEGFKCEFQEDEGLELVEKFSKDFGPVCEKLAEHNLVFAYHNHGFEFVKINGRYLFEELFERINTRVDDMINSGMLREAALLYPFRDLNSLNTVGYKELFKYISGEWELGMAIERIKKNTRVYAKKQMTWFKHDSSISWFHPDDKDAILRHILRYRTLS